MFNNFTASRKRGALILLAILIGIAGWRWRVAELGKEKGLPAGEQVETGNGKGEKGRGANDANSRSEESGSYGERSHYGENASEQVLIELNTADTTSLKTVRGIGSVFANRIVKYRKLIGGFHSKEELLKVYGIDEERYVGIAPQVWVDEEGEAYPSEVEDAGRNSGKEQYFGSKGDRYGDSDLDDERGSNRVREGEVDEKRGQNKDSLSEASFARGIDEGKDTEGRRMESDWDSKSTFSPEVNLNTADSMALVKVKGIGAKTASNILKYRKLIFYFHSVDQLKEVWGMREKNLEMIRKQVFIGKDLDRFPHLKVNEMDVKELAAHYYLDYKKARLIVAYRGQHGNYGSVADLQKIRGIDPDVWGKLGPYLEF